MIEGIDYYIDKGKYVFTEHFLRKRNYCCGNGCRHCPYVSQNLVVSGCVIVQKGVIYQKKSR